MRCVPRLWATLRHRRRTGARGVYDTAAGEFATHSSNGRQAADGPRRPRLAFGAACCGQCCRWLRWRGVAAAAVAWRARCSALKLSRGASSWPRQYRDTPRCPHRSQSRHGHEAGPRAGFRVTQRPADGRVAAPSLAHRPSAVTPRLSRASVADMRTLHVFLLARCSAWPMIDAALQYDYLNTYSCPPQRCLARKCAPARRRHRSGRVLCGCRAEPVTPPCSVDVPRGCDAPS
jgi:hypothetical protein